MRRRGRATQRTTGSTSRSATPVPASTVGQHEAIFEEFRQADGGERRAPVSASRSAAGWPERWAATSRVESEPGTGSVFHLTLPLDCRAAPSTPAADRAATPSTPDQRLLLSIDDDPSVAPLLQKMLAGRGYRVVAARPAPSAAVERRTAACGRTRSCSTCSCTERDGDEILRELKTRPGDPRDPGHRASRSSTPTTCPSSRTDTSASRWTRTALLSALDGPRAQRGRHADGDDPAGRGHRPRTSPWRGKLLRAAGHEVLTAETARAGHRPRPRAASRPRPDGSRAARTWTGGRRSTELRADPATAGPARRRLHRARDGGRPRTRARRRASTAT